MKILRNILFVAVVLVVSYMVSPFLGGLYGSFFNKVDLGAGYIGLVGLPLAYILLLSFVFTSFGDKHKYWWIGVLLIPALVFEIYFDFGHIYFPIAVGLVGWLIGVGVKRLVASRKKSQTL